MRPPKEVDQPTYEVVGPIERFDFNDSIEARMFLRPDNPRFEEYYNLRPEFKTRDEENRQTAVDSILKILAQGPLNEQFAYAVFYGVEALGMEEIVTGNIPTPFAVQPGMKIEVAPEVASQKVKDFGIYLGASRVRLTKLREEWIMKNYQPLVGHVSSVDTPELDYENVICMAIKQDLKMIRNGNGLAEFTEVRWTYARASLISNVMANFIRRLGYRARALATANAPYLVVPTFVDAGIGEQGRCGYVVTKEFGNNFRPAAVVTDMPLSLDKPLDFGVQDFCQKCMICANECPVNAIPTGGPVVVRGVKRWDIDREKCFRYWVSAGRPCAICQVVCPWSHEQNLFHNTIRETAENLPFMRRLLILGEEVTYGKFKPAPSPDWMSTPAGKLSTDGTARRKGWG